MPQLAMARTIHQIVTGTPSLPLIQLNATPATPTHIKTKLKSPQVI